MSLLKNNNFKIGDWIILSEEHINFLIENSILKEGQFTRRARNIIGITNEQKGLLLIDINNSEQEVNKRDYRFATDREIKEAKINS